MLTRKRIVSTGIAALLGLSVLAAPSLAGAQYYRYRQNTKAENNSRNNAYLLGAAGILLGANHQSTLGTIALAGAAYEAYQMQHQIDQRHRTYGYYNNGGYYGNDGYYNNNAPYYGYNQNRSNDGDSDDYRYGSRNNYNYGYDNRAQNGYYDQYGAWHSTSNVWNSRDRASERGREERSEHSRSWRNRKDRDRDGD